ncbi:MAG TPA: amino acid adenylation domain-containing protein, partial [Thermoanaerobaculia bacterium]|nr:amino acid adenylation domain-containing protein [Thermoanaerobaculia bacterium]
PSFHQLLERVQQVALAAYAHQDLPFEKLVTTLAPQRDLATTPIFQVLLVLQNAWSSTRLAAGEGLTIELSDLETATAKLDLTLAAVETPAGIALLFEYSRDLFDGVTVERLARHFQALLADLTAREEGRDTAAPEPEIGALSLLTPAERQQILEWNATATVYPRDLCLHQLIERQARRTPGAVALVAEDESLTFRALNARANRLARHLRNLGAGPETVVAVAVERSAALVVGLLAILKAGGAYLPLAPDDPEERLRFMREDSRAPLLLTTRAAAGCLGELGPGAVLLDDPAAPWLRRSGRNLTNVARPDNLAYVIYTSGSTGRPKGVMNTHRGIVNRLLWMQDRYGLAGDDRVLQKTPVSFDVSVWELFWPLLTGAQLVMARPGGHRDPAYLLEVVAGRGITTLHFVPAMLRAFLDGIEDARSAAAVRLRRVLSSGEALPYDLEQRFAAAFGVPLHNLYGPTEAAVDVTHWPCDPASLRRLVPIGRPVANTRIHLLDRNGREVPIGVLGELHIGGVQLARGYLVRPDLTAERFVPAPFGERLYKTGDLARRLPDGAVDYLGRVDHQVKIRGVRIELGEIESVLAALPGVQAAAVRAVARSSSGGGPSAESRLVAYVVPHGEPEASPLDLRQALAARLPDAMVPADFVFLERLPLTPSGKVDRRALPDPVARRRRAGEAGSGVPRTPTEELLAGLWAELLGIEQVEVEIGDDFFRLGGHSLLAVRLAAQLRDLLGVELPLTRLFELPRLKDLAREVESRAGRLLPTIPTRLSARRPAAEAPLSFAQERLWVLDVIDPGNPTYNIPGALRFIGPLDAAALAASLGEIRRRHEVLRTTFVTRGGVPVAVVSKAAENGAGLLLPWIDLSLLPAPRRTAEASRLTAAESRRPFDLATGPLLRAALLRLAVAEHVLLLNQHHIVSDGWSIELLGRELAVLYTAILSSTAPVLPALPIQYADFAAWQREWLAGDVLAAELAYWREQLADARGEPPLLDLPYDRPRSSAPSLSGARRTLVLPAALHGELTVLAQRHGATLFMTLLVAFDTLLWRYTGQSDVAVGTPVANRGRLEVQNLIGLFVNTLVLRLDLAGDPGFAALLAEARRTALAAYSHQDVPFDKLVSELTPQRGPRETPFFHVLLALQPALPALALPGLAGEILDTDSGTAKFELSLAFQRRPSGELAGIWTYRTDLFDAPTLERLGAQLANLLAAAAAGEDRRLSELPLLSPAERHQLQIEWNESPWEAGGEDLVQAPFQRQAARQPEAVALIDGQEALSYGELAAWVDRLAEELRALGVGPERRVAVCSEPSFAMFAGLLAVLQAGGAYLPLDPAHPRERLAQVFADSGAEVLLAEERVVDRLPAADRLVLFDPFCGARRPHAAARGREADPGNAAYVLYTSGSTGRPKGVVVSHRAVVNRLRFQVASDLASEARVLQRTRLGFDVSVVEIFAPLWAGATVVLTP